MEGINIMKKLIIICLILTILPSCVTPDPRGLHGRVLRDMTMDQNYMLVKAKGNAYYVCPELPNGDFMLPQKRGLF